MKTESLRVSFESSNNYETLNELTDSTKNIWLVFHGMGFLSRYFLRSFQHLKPEENYIIAPQAPSKYYLKNDFKYVGASWLTKEDTLREMQNLNHYLNAVYERENLGNVHQRLILLGFSQGVSVMLRWMVQQRLQVSQLIAYAGSLPEELNASHFDFLDFTQTQVSFIYGKKDEYLTPQKLEHELRKLHSCFQDRVQLTQFDGAHELKPEIIQQVALT